MLTFTPGIRKQKISIAINKDNVVEPDETFSVILSNPVNAAITVGTATGTILNDDGTTVVNKTAIASAKDGYVCSAGAKSCKQRSECFIERLYRYCNH